MSLVVPAQVLKATESSALSSLRDSFHGKELDVEINFGLLEEVDLDDLRRAAKNVGDLKVVRALDSISLAFSGDFSRPVSNFKAFQSVLEAYLKQECLDGWLYVQEEDGFFYPVLVTAVSYQDQNRYSSNQTKQPIVYIHTTSYGLLDSESGLGMVQRSFSFRPVDVVRRKIGDILSSQGLFKETPELKRDYKESMLRYEDMAGAFGKQFKVSGASYHKCGYSGYETYRLENAKVIHDLEFKSVAPIKYHEESFLFEGVLDEDGSQKVGRVPAHPLVRVFDLGTHEFFWVNSGTMTPHQYDKSIGDKLILPKTHRDLLDVLTKDIGLFVDDFVEGKSASNVILCKGIPGVGKTLTAEVYAEITERPLYSIRTGSLGTDPVAIESNLTTIFARGKKWGCVLLLDEADVFVTQRGLNIQQNAIVAEFLRTLEYFDGLLFMTTNRSDDIDEAIVSRCAAIIEYKPPCADDARLIFKVLGEQNQIELSDDLVIQLVETFPGITPRDMKMLLRLALRVSKAHNEPLSLDIFRKCAIFRGIK